MLDAILRYRNDEPQLREALAALARRIVAAGRRDRRLVAEVEHAVAIDPHAAFRFDSDASATLEIAGERWSAGRFEATSIATLRARCTAPSERARIHLHVLTGASLLTDIGALQAYSGNDALHRTGAGRE